MPPMSRSPIVQALESMASSQLFGANARQHAAQRQTTRIDVSKGAGAGLDMTLPAQHIFSTQLPACAGSLTSDPGENAQWFTVRDSIVVPAQAGIQCIQRHPMVWPPACAGATVMVVPITRHIWLGPRLRGGDGRKPFPHLGERARHPTSRAPLHNV